MFDSLIKIFEDKNLNQNMDLRKQLKNVKIQNAEQLEAVEEEVENAQVVIATLNGLRGSWDSFIQGMCARRKLLLLERFQDEHTQEDVQLIVREKDMGRSSSHN